MPDPTTLLSEPSSRISTALPAEVVIGIDLGTTAAKVTAFGVDDPWRRSASAEYPLSQPRPGWEEQNPDRMAATMLKCLADVVSACRGSQVVAVSLSTAMHGVIALGEDLRPLTPLVTWADSRAADIVTELREASGVTLHRRSGTPVHPMSPMAKLIWFQRNEPQLWEQARYWVGLKEWALLQLTGEVVTERSCASGTGLLDLHTGQYSPETLDLVGVKPDLLPEILSTTATLTLDAAVARRVGLPAGTTVVPGAGDGPCGNLGTGALGEGVAGLSIGTSGALRAVVPTPRVDDDARLFCYGLTDDAWVIGGAVSNGGSAARWVAQLFGAGPTALPDDVLMHIAAEAPPGCDGLIALPYLMAERAPLWDPSLTGAYLGLSRRHTRAHLVRAVVEGVARQLRAVLTDLQTQTTISQIRATGGVFRADLWRDVMADTLDRPLLVTDGADGSGLGAAVLGLLGTGRAQSLAEGLELLASPGIEIPTEPDPERAAVYRESREALGEYLDQLTRAVGSLTVDPQHSGR